MTDPTLRTDAILASRPWSAFYWPMLAAYFYSFVSLVLISAFAPSLLEVLNADDGVANREKWIFATLLQGIILVRMSIWAETVTGQPFATQIRAPINWFVFAVIVAPILHAATFFFFGSIFSTGEGDWTTRDGFDVSMFQMDRYSLMLLYIIILAPIVEEVGFRGILLGFLRGRGLPQIAAILVSAAGFALLHTQYTPPAILAIFVLGCFLGWLRFASRSLGPPILAHIAVNAFVTFG